MENLLKTIITKLNTGKEWKDTSTEKKRSAFKDCVKILMYYYFKRKVSIDLSSNKFNIEHIYPYSSRWDNQIDINRLGNLFPIIARYNFKRGNRSISIYSEYIDEDDYLHPMRHIIPLTEKYKKVIKHYIDSIPKIISNEEFCSQCINIETRYINNLIKQLYD